MKLKLIGLCSFFILCLTLKSRKVGACASGENLVDSTLKRIHVKSPPKNAADWEIAFILLSSQYKLMENNLTNALNALSKDHEIMKNNLTHECDKWKNEYLKVAAVQFTRSIIENGDLTLTYGGFSFPTIGEMKKSLQKNKGQLDETAVSEAQNLGGDRETTRRMRWLYYMTYAETNFAKELRKLLHTWKVSAFTLSGFFDRVYTICCNKIHGFSVDELDVKIAEAGFRMYGVSDSGIFDCLSIIFEIPKLTGFNPSTTTTVSV